jgi:predicted membrane channel-forming protein YqfA (hemolysin III family)
MADAYTKREEKRRGEVKNQLFYVIIGVILSFAVQLIYTWAQIEYPPHNTAFYPFFGFLLLAVVILSVLWALLANEASVELDHILKKLRTYLR